MFYFPQFSYIENRNVHISVLNGALWDMEQVHSGICETGLLHAIIGIRLSTTFVSVKLKELTLPQSTKHLFIKINLLRAICTQNSHVCVVNADRLTAQHSIVDIIDWWWSYWQIRYPNWHVQAAIEHRHRNWQERGGVFLYLIILLD